MLFSIRPADPEQDYAAIAELICAAQPQRMEARDLCEPVNRSPEGQVRQRFVAVGEDKGVIGYSLALHQSWDDPGAFYVWTTVSPAFRRQGIGTALYEHTLDFIRAHHPQRLSSEAREDCPAGLRFAERRGFEIHQLLFESTLDLASFDESRFAELLARVEAQGIRLRSLAELGDTPEARRKLYEVNRRTAEDDPGFAGPFPSFEQFHEHVFSASWFRAEGQILALDGERFVGLAAVGYDQQDNSAYNMMTGVERAYRRRGIAQALKLRAIRFAQDIGARLLRTHNDSQNQAILAINRKLGYQPQPGVYRLIQSL